MHLHRLTTLALLVGASCLGVSAHQTKGGDERNGPYDAVAGWWKPAPEHDGTWTWGEVSGVAADTPDRIIVAVWGDRDRQNRERPNGTNYLVVVNRNGEIVERWQQWDSILNKPHQVYISAYDPDRHVWLVERGGGRNVPMSILKFSRDGKRLVMKLGDGDDPPSRAAARKNPRPGPFDYGIRRVWPSFPTAAGCSPTVTGTHASSSTTRGASS